MAFSLVRCTLAINNIEETTIAADMCSLTQDLQFLNTITTPIALSNAKVATAISINLFNGNEWNDNGMENQ